MKYAFNHLQTRICTVTTICLLLAVLASSAFPTNYFASFAAAAALPLAQATTCATPNLRLSKQLTLDAGAEHSFVTGDFNKDGRQDLVVQTSVGKIYTLLGDGAGNFAEPTVLFLSNGGSFLQMATGDFNGDGKLDLITLGTDRLRIYLGDGSGHLSLGNEFSLNANGFLLGDFNKDGKTDIAVTLNCCPDGIVIYVSNASGFTATNYPWGSARVSAVADFNGDGNADVLTSDNYYPSSQVRLGNGRGQFTNGDYLYYGVQVFYFATTDFNKDGKVDVLGYTAQNRIGQDEANSRKLIVLSGDGVGHFTASYSNAPLDMIPFDSIAADFTGDGYPDIATRATDIFTNNASGNLCPAFRLSNSFANRVGAADFNGDSKADLLRQVSGDKIEVWLSGSGGTTNTPPSITLFDSTWQQASPSGVLEFGSVRDLETPWKDLKLDVVSAPPGVSVTNPFSNDGAVRATVRVDCSATPGVNLVKLRATDGGGLSATTDWKLTVLPNPAPELGAYPNAPTVSVNQTAIFQPNIPLRDNSPIAPTIVASAPTFQGIIKVDGQGNVTVNNASPVGSHLFTVTATDDCGAKTIRTFTLVVTSDAGAGCSTPIFNNPVNIGANNHPYGLASGDFNGDGKADLATTNFYDNTVTVLLTGANGFTKQAPIAVGVLPNYIVAKDLNNDGKLDLTVVNRGSDTVTILLGNGNGTFTKKGDYEVGNKSTGVGIGDFNGDGRPDLILPNDGFGNATFLLGNGDGSFGPLRYYFAGNSPQPPVVADFNKDGILDVAFPNYFSGEVAIMLNRGDGSFLSPLFIGDLGGSGVEAIATGDVNGDGNVDLAVTNTTTNQVFTILGDGRGGFRRGGGFATFSDYPASIVIADFTGDGKADIAVGGYNNDRLHIFKGLGNGFDNNAPLVLPVGAEPLSLLTNDFNGDGKPDLAVANLGSGTVSVLLNGCGK